MEGRMIITGSHNLMDTWVIENCYNSRLVVRYLLSLLQTLKQSLHGTVDCVYSFLFFNVIKPQWKESDYCIRFSLLRCLINCEENASASTRISLITTCSGHACDTAKYQWQLVSLDSHGLESPEILERDMTQTELNISGIIVKANKLKGGFTYRLKVNTVNEPQGIAAYQFTINAPPQLGKCTVTPKTGEALKIKFNFKCSGWEVRKWGKRKCSRQGKHIQI